MPTSTITFTGLLVFRHDPATDYYEVGVLRARNAHDRHIFRILVTPNPDGSATPLSLKEELEDIVQEGHVYWQLDVDPPGASRAGVEANRAYPEDRMNSSDRNKQDFGWIIHLEELHPQPLRRAPNALQPVITLKTGRLFTSCKSEAVDLVRPRDSREFGFISGAISLEINTSAGQEPVLSYVNTEGRKTEIFRLLNTEEMPYSVSIRNTPEIGSPPGGHFHLFYDLLFPEVPHNDRFRIELQTPVTAPPDRCTSIVGDPDPFRCGGMLVEGDPLG